MPLNHIALTVSDRERSARFYAGHFDLTERVHDDEHLLILGSPDARGIARTTLSGMTTLTAVAHSAMIPG